MYFDLQHKPIVIYKPLRFPTLRHCFNAQVAPNIYFRVKRRRTLNF